MLTIEEALAIILAEVPAPKAAETPLAECVGAVLAEDVASDLDMPPFDKAMMDGYAARAGDVGPLRVIEEIPAGRPPAKRVEAGTCSKIMTGAPMPEGADAVREVEKTSRDGERVSFHEPVKPGQNVAPRGSDVKKGERVLGAGRRIHAAETGALAAVGKTRVKVWTRPRVAVLATGDELVAPERVPGPGQIRNSNSAMLAAQVRAMGLACDDLGTVGDDREAIRSRIREGMSRDVLLLSGGVSAGDWDLVIPALEAEGVTIRAHKVKIKPGKPFCFAPRVFGLPGNPVSAFVIFEVFVRPYLGRMMGTSLDRPRIQARLETPLPKKIDRVHYLPASIRYEAGEYVAAALPWKGSADLFAVAKADGFIVVPIQTAYEKGARVECLPL